MKRFWQVLVVFTSFLAILFGAIGGSDDGNVARIERDIGFWNTVFTTLAEWHGTFFSHLVFSLFLLCFATIVLHVRRGLWIALGLTALGSTVGAIVHTTTSRLSTMYIGEGGIGEFVLGVFFLSIIVGAQEAAIGFIVTGLMWISKLLAIRLWTWLKGTPTYR